MIAEDFGEKVSAITWGITLVLMLRSVGAVIFGLAGDKWGRKWPLIINLLLFVIFELGAGFANNLKQFLIWRAFFGIAMGGLYGNACATALEDAPLEARSFLSGLFQEGYAFGYLLAVIFKRAIADTSPHGWRALFWFSAGPPVLIIIYRMFLPETDGYLAQKNIEKESVGKEFIQQGKVALKQYWLLLIYMVVLMALMNFNSHGSQDLYPTFLSAQLGFSDNASTVTNVVANLGALIGGIVAGHFSSIIGRRLTIAICCVLGGAMVYPWAFSRSNAGINASVFFMQALGVQSSWGVIPIHLSELSPPRFRAFIVGISYQLGNLASSASSTIEATIGERFPLTDENGNYVEGKFNYGKVMAIFMGCVFSVLLIVILVGPENLHANLVSRDPDEEIAAAQQAYFEEKAEASHVEGRPVAETNNEVEEHYRV